MSRASAEEDAEDENDGEEVDDTAGETAGWLPVGVSGWSESPDSVAQPEEDIVKCYRWPGSSVSRGY